MISTSGHLFFATFAAYLLAAFLYIGRITLRRRNPKHFATAERIGDLAFKLSAAGLLLHGMAIGLRWAGSGQAPLSNLFEYISFTGWATMLFFVTLSFWYKFPGLGAFVAPLGVIVIGYASVFPQEVTPLVPILQSNWLILHVATAALGEGAFAVGFGAALMYLLRTRSDQGNPWEERCLEFFFYLVATLVGFIILALGLKWSGYTAELSAIGANGPSILRYGIPPLVGPNGSSPGDALWLGIDLPLVTAPVWMKGIAAAKNLNTLLFSLVMGGVLYGLMRLAARGPVRRVGSRAVAGMNPQLLDEVSYRGIALGFPLFTLGAIVFAMIWAQKAWGSYWSWDPKETWALISWLFYAGYLHMRIVRGWEGRLAAWTAVIGFVVIIFTLVGVNLLISGMHSYAGG